MSEDKSSSVEAFSLTIENPGGTSTSEVSDFYTMSPGLLSLGSFGSLSGIITGVPVLPSEIPLHDQNDAQMNEVVAVNARNVAEDAVQKGMLDTEAEYIDVTSLLVLPQNEAARILGIPTSTLSKRWKEVAVGRKWPCRTVTKLDKEISGLVRNIPSDGEIPPNVAERLGILMNERKKCLTPMKLRLRVNPTIQK